MNNVIALWEVVSMSCIYYLPMNTLTNFNDYIKCMCVNIVRYGN